MPSERTGEAIRIAETDAENRRCFTVMRQLRPALEVDEYLGLTAVQRGRVVPQKC